MGLLRSYPNQTPLLCLEAIINAGGGACAWGSFEAAAATEERGGGAQHCPSPRLLLLDLMASELLRLTGLGLLLALRCFQVTERERESGPPCNPAEPLPSSLLTLVVGRWLCSQAAISTGVLPASLLRTRHPEICSSLASALSCDVIPCRLQVFCFCGKL